MRYFQKVGRWQHRHPHYPKRRLRDFEEDGPRYGFPALPTSRRGVGEQPRPSKSGLPKKTGPTRNSKPLPTLQFSGYPQLLLPAWSIGKVPSRGHESQEEPRSESQLVRSCYPRKAKKTPRGGASFGQYTQGYERVRNQEDALVPAFPAPDSMPHTAITARSSPKLLCSPRSQVPVTQRLHRERSSQEDPIGGALTLRFSSLPMP